VFKFRKKKKKKGKVIKMQKKLLCLILAISLFAIPAFAEVSFSDIDSSHWGYANVMKLVNDGTVKGYPDGTFKPAGQVTRAEFVKMMGEGSVKRASDFSDVDASHWAYNYVMTSQFDDGSNEFKPSQPITREETIVLLWKRAGADASVIAPSIITNQATNKEAVAWAYGTGIMMGDDGVNLRLSGTLSRAEAAALIVRARETDFTAARKNFSDVASPELLQTIFESFSLFDNYSGYSADKTLTNGELSRAALRIATSSFTTSSVYAPFAARGSFEHTYANDIAIMSSIVFGDSCNNAGFADKLATREDMVAALSAAVIRKSSKAVSFGNTGNYYKDITGDIEKKKDVYLTFAYEKGIALNGDGTIGAGKNATYKDMAAVLIQLDALMGTQTAFSTNMKGDDFVTYDVKLNKNLVSYPSNHEIFACVSEGIPASVYAREYTGKEPKENYNFSREYGVMFANYFKKAVDGAKKQAGIEMEFVLYPELIWDTGKNFKVRALVKINEVGSTPVPLYTLVPANQRITGEEGFIQKGMEFFAEFDVAYYALIM